MPRPRPVILSTPGLFVPEADCALLQHALRGERHPVLARLRDDAYAVAADFTARQAEAEAATAGSTLTIAQAAGMLSLTRRQVRWLIDSGALEASQGAGRIWSITRESVVERRLHGDTSRA